MEPPRSEVADELLELHAEIGRLQRRVHECNALALVESGGQYIAPQVERLAYAHVSRSDLLMAARFADLTYGTRKEPEADLSSSLSHRGSVAGGIAHKVASVGGAVISTPLHALQSIAHGCGVSAESSSSLAGSAPSTAESAAHAEPAVLPVRRGTTVGRPVVPSGTQKPGFCATDWAALVQHRDDPAELAARALTLLDRHPQQVKFPTFCGRLVEAVRLNPDMRLVKHEESDAHKFDGQVAVWASDSKHLVLVAWRGSDSAVDAKWDVASFRECPFGADAKRTGFRAGVGFVRQYMGEDLASRIHAEVRKLLNENPAYDLMVVGHSLGGALANLSGFELAREFPATLVTTVTFGCPRSVNAKLARAIRAQRNLRIYRLVNLTDAVARIPPWSFGARHTGYCVWLCDGAVRTPTKYGKQPGGLLNALRWMPLEVAVGRVRAAAPKLDLTSRSTLHSPTRVAPRPRAAGESFDPDAPDGLLHPAHAGLRLGCLRRDAEARPAHLHLRRCHPTNSCRRITRLSMYEKRAARGL